MEHMIPMEQTEEPTTHPGQCTAKSKRSQKRCGKYAMKGQTVCAFHGGKAPRALANAEAAIERADFQLRGLVMPAVDALERLLKADSEAAILGAAKDILDRGGLKATHRVEVDSEITVLRPW